jgi:PQQ-dependent catabolism-associated CXXCW motif protein
MDRARLFRAGTSPLPCLLLAAAMSAALATDAPEPPGYWSGPMQGDVPATLAGGKVIQTGELAALIERGGLILIDVAEPPHRPDNLAGDAVWKPLPHRNIGGSAWIPGAGTAELEAGRETAFRAHLARLMGDDLERPVVFYCHRKCWASWNAAKRAISFGYRDVHWYKDGVEGWQDGGRDLAPARTRSPLY